MDEKPTFEERFGKTIAKILFWLTAVLFLYGLYATLTYSWPMSAGNYGSALQSAVSDQPIALYDEAIVLYRKGDYQLARRVLGKAKTECNDSNGQLPDSRKSLAAEMSFLEGNVLSKMMDQAAASGAADEAQNDRQSAMKAYQECLLLNPDHMQAKYNLERLQLVPPKKGGGSGKGGNDKNSPQSQNQPDKPGGPGRGGANEGI